jgi:hypothetical protein
VIHSDWLKLFRSFNFLAAVVFLFAFLTSVAFTAMPNPDEREVMQTTTRFHAELTRARPPKPWHPPADTGPVPTPR